jgi:hypothetical protein
MTLSHTAQGLASLGRNGDSMLVHMSPEEVGGLKQIGDSLGIKMSTNPHTGMPEAFSFGDFFTSFLPTIVGAAVGGPAGAGFMSSTMTPILAGAGTGALLAAAKGDDPLMGGLMGGMGGYGGAGLGQTFSKAFGSAGKAAGTTAGAMDDLIAAGTQNMGGGAGNIGAFSNFKNTISPVASATPKVTSLTNQISPFTNNSLGADLGIRNVNPTVGVNAGGYDSAAAAAAELAKPSQAMSNLGDLGTGIKNLTGFGDMSVSDAYKKFTDAGGTAMDLAMPVGGAVLSGIEPSDLYGDPMQDDKKDKYDPYSRLNLSNDTGLRLVAKGGYIDGYALGGAVTSNPSVGGGLSDLYNRPEGQTTQNISSDAYGLGRLSALGSEQAMNQAKTLGYADGGDVSNYRQDQKALNLNELPTLNTVTGEQISAGGLGGLSDPFQGKTGAIYDIARAKDKLRPGSVPHGYSSFVYNILKKNSNMAKGGYLDGDGDGMSDSIPATIEGKQPARLADGEFVIPADVVSHLGNGSSKAGSKRLYAMLDKVRHARTGNKKQGKEIKAEKYLPA